MEMGIKLSISWGYWGIKRKNAEYNAWILVNFFKSGSHYVAQAGLKLTILLSPPPKC
jgi:hypothetical protein